MLNDGGAINLDSRSTPVAVTNTMLVQRARIFNFVTRGLTCSLLRGTTFRDSKVRSFT